MADLTKYAKGKRMVHEDEIKQIEQNTKEIVDLKEDLQGKVNSYVVTNITALTSDFINKLKSGDVVVKQTGSGQHPQYHSYRVSFMKDNEGMCLTYTDASCSETVSYDKSGNNWVYNSTDVTTFSNFATKDELPAEVEAITPTGTEEALEGLKIGDTSYKVGGGDKLYRHDITATYGNSAGDSALLSFVFINKDATPLQDNQSLILAIYNAGYNSNGKLMQCSYIKYEASSTSFSHYGIAFYEDISKSNFQVKVIDKTGTISFIDAISGTGSQKSFLDKISEL